MSTSTSIAPPSPLGECVVCGKESSTRCSKCAKGGVEWMYFCSTEHQKLIWNTHKRVCGASFSWPALTLKEKKEMIDLSTKTYMEPKGPTTWLAEVGPLIIAHQHLGAGDVSAGAIPAVFGALIDRVVVGSLQGSVDQYIVYNFRASAFDVKAKLTTGTFSELHKLIASDPVGFLAWTQLNHAPSTLKSFENSWYSDFQHKTMILVGTLNYFLLAPGSTVASSLGPLTWTSNKVRDYALEVVKEVSSTEATEILEDYLPALTKVAGAIRGPLEELRNHKCVGTCYDDF
ncbi:hypothetical protein JCM5353_000799 [Sporobolomyces roseus]